MMTEILQKPKDRLEPTMEELVARAHAMVPQLAEQAESVERHRRVPQKTIDMFREAEFFKLLQPARFGGFERGFEEMVRIDFELGSACGSAAWCGSLAMAHQWFAALFPIEAQEEVWDNPANILAGSYAPLGIAEPAAGGYRVKGSWGYTSNCENSEWYMLGVMLPDPGNGDVRRPGVMLVPRSHIRIEDSWHMAGLGGTGSQTVVIDEPTFVPAHRFILRSDIMDGTSPGGRVHDAPLYRVPWAAALSFSLAAPAIGMAQGAVNNFIEWARGSKSQLAYVQRNLAEASAAVDAAKLVILRRIEALTRAMNAEAIGDEDRILARRDQSYAVKLAVNGINLLIEAMSAGGMDLSSPVQRMWRDANTGARHVSLHWEDASVLYGQWLLGLEPKGAF
jgi:alkylation response protein AidB-like acyl-CoA dehydrogenase